MEGISFNSSKFYEFIDRLNPQNSGILFSILFHLIILLFAVGLPNFFGPKDIFVPNIIPIEILNVTDTTNIERTETDSEVNNISKTKSKKFNSSENTEVQKQFEINQNIKSFNNETQTKLEIKEKANINIEEKKNIEIKQKEILNTRTKIETIKTNKIKPKLKPKPVKVEQLRNNNSDVKIEPRIKEVSKIIDKEDITKPKPKPKEDFNIASMLKDLRNEQSNNIIDKEDEVLKEEKNQQGSEEKTENIVLSISEIDLLRQQLSGCWNAPAGAVINIGDKVTISAKVNKNMKVFDSSVRIVDTNISKSNPFYGPITDSAMRTLLNPECTPLKLPKDKYDLWKNLTITFDYSIMKGY